MIGLQKCFSDLYFYRICEPDRHPSGVDVWGRNFAGAEAHTLIALRERILSHKNAFTLVKNCDNLLVMIGRKGDHPERLPREFQEELAQYGYCTLGIVLASKLNDVCYIEWVESFLRGYGIGTFLMAEISVRMKCKAYVPLDISGEDAEKYWKKYFRRQFDTYDELVEWMIAKGVDMNLLKGYNEEMFKSKKIKN